MQSPLNIDQTVERYNLDEDMKESLISFDNFIWQDCRIESVEQLVDYEKEYQRYDKVFDFCYDNEIGEFGCVEMEDGPLSLLHKSRFQLLSKGLKENPVGKDFMAAALCPSSKRLKCSAKRYAVCVSLPVFISPSVMYLCWNSFFIFSASVR